MNSAPNDCRSKNSPRLWVSSRPPLFFRKTLCHHRSYAAAEGCRVNRKFALGNARLIKQQLRRVREIIGRTRFASLRGQSLDQVVVGVNFQNRCGKRIDPAMLFQQPFEVHVDAAFIGDQANRTVGQAG